MSPEKALNLVVDAAVTQWASNTKQFELHEALDLILRQYGETTAYRALGIAWKKSRPIGVRQ